MFDGRSIKTDASGRVHGFKWVWDGTATDEATGFSVVSKHYKSRNGAQEHAREELFNAMVNNRLI